MLIESVCRNFPTVTTNNLKLQETHPESFITFTCSNIFSGIYCIWDGYSVLKRNRASFRKFCIYKRMPNSW